MNLNSLNPLNHRTGRAAVASLFDPTFIIVFGWSALFCWSMVYGYGWTASIVWLAAYGFLSGITYRQAYRATIAEHDRARRSAPTFEDTRRYVAELHDLYERVAAVKAQADALDGRLDTLDTRVAQAGDTQARIDRGLAQLR